MENTFAETEGTVSVIALSASGLSAFDEIAVSVVAAELSGIDLNASSFFPAAGQLANNSGVLRLVPGPSGREGYYWTSSVGEDGDSRMVDFNKSMLLYNTNKRASGCSVRCVRVL